MKRSAINEACRQAAACFGRHHWALPPAPRWDITDFGMGDFSRFGLTLITLTNEPEYCEKIMYARRGQKTPCHTHARKKEDIICRTGSLTLELWGSKPGAAPDTTIPARVKVDGVQREIASGGRLVLGAGSRVTLEPGVWHAFWTDGEECIIGEVSTTNDDLNDNFFVDPSVGRFPEIDEDEPPIVRLVRD